jgi:hypothetical protein
MQALRFKQHRWRPPRSRGFAFNTSKRLRALQATSIGGAANRNDFAGERVASSHRLSGNSRGADIQAMRNLLADEDRGGVEHLFLGLRVQDKRLRKPLVF